MTVETLEKIGDLLTLREIAKIKGATPNAVYLWVRMNNIPCKRIGRALLVRSVDAEKYLPRGK